MFLFFSVFRVFRGLSLNSCPFLSSFVPFVVMSLVVALLLWVIRGDALVATPLRCVFIRHFLHVLPPGLKKT